MKEFISTQELKQIGFTERKWSDEGIHFVEYRLRKGELAVCVNLAYEKGVLFEQYVELLIGREYEALKHIKSKAQLTLLLNAVFDTKIHKSTSGI